MNNHLKKSFIYIFGALLLGFAISLSYKVGLGGDPLGVFYEGLSKSLNISVTIVSAILSSILILIAFVIDKNQVKIGTIFSVLFLSMGIKLGDTFIPIFHNNALRYGLVLIILFLYALSISLMIKADIGKSAYDAMIFSFSNKFKLNYPLMRFIIDGAFLILGFTLGGVFHIGTIVLLLLTGVTTQRLLVGLKF